MPNKVSFEEYCEQYREKAQRFLNNHGKMKMVSNHARTNSEN